MPSIFDWSRLKHLHLQGPSMIDFIKPLNGARLHLKVLVLDSICELDRGDEARQVLERFISGLAAGLERLRLVNLTRRISLHCLSPHGRTLTDLTLRDAIYRIKPYIEFSERPVASGLMTTEELKYLRRTCPNLQFLVTDADVVGQVVSLHHITCFISA